jgi:hypothetical protein
MLREEDHEFETRLGYIVKLCLHKANEQKKEV